MPCSRFLRRSVSTLLLLVAVGAQAQVAYPELRRLYQLSEQRTDFVFVLDTSGSMRPFYSQVRRACIEFLKALPPEDNLYFYCFDRQVYPISPAGAKAKDWAQVASQIPDVPRGTHTDIGAALEQVMATLSRREASPIAFIVFITDGKHEPASESLYPVDTRSGRWGALRQSAREVAKTKEVFRVFAIGLKDNTDAQLLARIFGASNTSVLFTRPEQLQSYLRQVQNNLIAVRLKSAVQNDLANQRIAIPAEATSVSIRLAVGRTSVQSVPLTSTFRPLTIAWRSGGVEREVEGVHVVVLPLEKKLTAEGGASAEEQALRVEVSAPPAQSNRLMLRRERTIPIQLTIPYRAIAEPAGEIRQLGLSPDVRLHNDTGQIGEAIPLDLTITVEEGVAPSALAIRWFGLTALIALVGFALWSFSPKPVGWIVAGYDQYPLENQSEAIREWNANLIKILALSAGGTALGAVAGFLIGQWWSFYLFQIVLGLAGALIGYRIWGRKGVRVGRASDAHLVLEGAEQTWVVYTTATDVRARLLPSGTDLSLYANPQIDLGGGQIVEWSRTL